MWQFGIKDIIDIVLVAILLYQIYKMMKETGTINIFVGVLTFIALWILVTQVLEMRLLGAIMDKVISVGLVTLVIIFQDEIRRFLLDLGSRKRWKFFLNIFLKQNDEDGKSETISAVVRACQNMASTKTGALIAIQQNTDLKMYELTGDKIDADVSTRLIENIFFKNSPLHDGAMIIANNRISAAACILPVSHNQDIPKMLGLRHRSAVGLSQETDAKVIVVSEETGYITLTHNGRLYRNLKPSDLEKMLLD
ncbi:MAG: diadenylate cyclase CdaA [Bacteroidales bacterium]|nr:diadenylate cyclase CdaA [Bacteroidales bacterium]